MPTGLKRYQHEGDLHFITFSCYRRQPYLSDPGAYSTLEQALEQTRRRHNLEVHGDVFMPEHPAIGFQAAAGTTLHG